jgi:hypothetical protein
VYENVALLSRLDTMFLRTTRSYFKNVYIEGTDDWMGGGQISVWEDSTLVYPTGSGVMSASNVVFRNCRFEATRGMQFYKAEYGGAARPNVLINSVVPVASTQSPVAWVRGKAAPRPGVYSLTYHNKDSAGNPAILYDSKSMRRSCPGTHQQRGSLLQFLESLRAAPMEWWTTGIGRSAPTSPRAAKRTSINGIAGSGVVRTGGTLRPSARH